MHSNHRNERNQAHAVPAVTAQLAHERIYDTAGASKFIYDEYGERISRQTYRKWRCVGGGPAFFKGVGGRVFYREGTLRAWIEAKRSPEVGSTSELTERSAA